MISLTTKESTVQASSQKLAVQSEQSEHHSSKNNNTIMLDFKAAKSMAEESKESKEMKTDFLSSSDSLDSSLIDPTVQVSQGKDSEQALLTYALIENSSEEVAVSLIQHRKINLQQKMCLKSGCQDSFLAFAVYENKSKVVRAILSKDKKQNPNEKMSREGYQQYSLLACAVYKKYPEVVKVLLQYGADPNVPMPETKQSLLAYALTQGYTEIALALIQSGKIDLRDGIEWKGCKDGKCSFLAHAVYYQYTEVVQALLRHGADPNSEVANNPGQSLLSYALTQGYIEIAVAFIQSGKVNYQEGMQVKGCKNGKCPFLTYAVHENMPAAVEALLSSESKRDPDEKLPYEGYEEYSLLAYAVYKKYPELVRVLLRHGANPNVVMPGTEQSLLTYALTQRNDYYTEIAVALIQSGKVNVSEEMKLEGCKDEKCSFLAYSVYKNEPKAVEALLSSESKQNPDEKIAHKGSYQKWPALAYAVYWIYEEVVRSLLRHGANPNIDMPGTNPKQSLLAYAITKNYTDTVASLIQSERINLLDGLKLEECKDSKDNKDGKCSFLAYAVYNNKPGLAALLLDQRNWREEKDAPDPNETIPYKNYQEYSLLAYAVYEKYPELVKALLRHGANPNVPMPGTKPKQSLLAYALAQGYTEIAVALIQSGQVNLQESIEWEGCKDEKHSFLAYAVHENMPNVVEALLSSESKQNPDEKIPHKGIPGYFLLAYAICVHYKYPELAKSLLCHGANPNVPMPGTNQSLLTYALTQGYTEIAVALIQSGKVNFQEKMELKECKGEKYSFLAYAAYFYKDMPGVAEALLSSESKQDPDEKIAHKGYRKYSLLSYAVYENCPELVKALLSHGANPNDIMPGTNQSLLTYALTNGYTEIAMALIESKKINLQGKMALEECQDGQCSFLAYAVYQNQPKIAKALLNAEKKQHSNEKIVHKGKYQGRSLLAYAIENGYTETATVLLNDRPTHQRYFVEEWLEKVWMEKLSQKSSSYSLEVAYPENSSEYEVQSNQWSHGCSFNKILLIFSPTQKIWKAYIRRGDTSQTKGTIEEKTVAPTSVLGKLLKDINKANLTSYDWKPLQKILDQDSFLKGYVNDDGIVTKIWKWLKKSVLCLLDSNWWEKNWGKTLLTVLLAVGIGIGFEFFLPLLGTALGIGAIHALGVSAIEGTMIGCMSCLFEATYNYLKYGKWDMSIGSVLGTVFFSSLMSVLLYPVFGTLLGSGVITNATGEVIESTAEVTIGMITKRITMGTLKGLKDWGKKFLQSTWYEYVDLENIERNPEIDSESLKKLKEKNDQMLIAMRQQLKTVLEIEGELKEMDRQATLEVLHRIQLDQVELQTLPFLQHPSSPQEVVHSNQKPSAAPVSATLGMDPSAAHTLVFSSQSFLFGSSSSSFFSCSSGRSASNAAPSSLSTGISSPKSKDRERGDEKKESKEEKRTHANLCLS